MSVYLWFARCARLTPRGERRRASVASELSTHCNGADFIETVRAVALRKAFLSPFGAKVWDVMNKLWRAAPASPGAPQPSEDQGQLPPGLLPVGRSQPPW